jgi:hypothetical protein
METTIEIENQARQALPRLTHDNILLKRELEAERDHSDYLKSEVSRFDKDLQMMRDRVNDLTMALRFAQDDLGYPTCTDCNALGGEAIERDVYSKDGLEISHTEHIGWHDWLDVPCRTCDGTGREPK